MLYPRESATNIQTSNISFNESFFLCSNQNLQTYCTMTTTAAKTTDELWKKTEALISVTEKHPFLVAMVDGTLDMDSFRYYVIQDALYLKDFADCLRRLSLNDNVSTQDSNRLEEFASGAEMAELSLHNSFFKQWDIVADGVEQMPHTLLYTSYMKRVITTGTHAEGLAVLLPCFWVYGHVGEVMLKLRDVLGNQVTRPPQFDAWIDMYGGEEFAKEVRDYKQMVDIALESANETTRSLMEEHYVMCCKLEHMFWDQATIQMEWPNIVHNVTNGSKN